MVMPENNQNLTLDDLGKFTEDVLLPAVKDIVDSSVNTAIDSAKQEIKEDIEIKLSPIWQEITSIKENIAWIKEKIWRMDKAGSEDVIAVNSEVEKLKTRVMELENQVKAMQAS